MGHLFAHCLSSQASALPRAPRSVWTFYSAENKDCEMSVSVLSYCADAEQNSTKLEQIGILSSRLGLSSQMLRQKVCRTPYGHAGDSGCKALRD